MICGCAPFADALNAVLRFESSGNLVEDDRHRYQYDAWNRLVLVQRIAADGNGTDAATLHAAEYDGLGRRVEKGVSNCGDLDGTFRFWYNGQQMIERRDGSSNVLTQAYYGTQYIDELVAIKLEHGYAVVSQDANYNVTTLTDLAGRVLERVFTTEYGQPILESDSYFGDYDADGDVDATDDGFLGSGQTCWGTATGACRVFDFNGDGTLDAADETIMTALVAAPTTNRVHHARRSSPVGNLFLHQGLVYDAEIAAYQNRARAYLPIEQRFAQRDPLALRTGNLHQLALRHLNGGHLYSYHRLSPLNNSDPSGLSCGSIGTDWLVPDAPFGVDISSCCDTHDRCYESIVISRQKCDTDFYNCILGTCLHKRAALWGYTNPLCGAIASIYYRAVRLGGWGPYQIGRIKGIGNVCGWW